MNKRRKGGTGKKVALETDLLACVCGLVKIVVRRFFGPSAGSVVFLVNWSRSAVFDAQEAVIGVGFAVCAADRFELLRANPWAALEGEGRQATLHRHDEHVLAAVLLPHKALVRVEFVVRSADIAGGFTFAVGFTVSSSSTIFERNWYNSESACLLLQFATWPIGVSVGAADWADLIFFVGAARAVDEIGFGLQLCAGSDVSQLNSTSEKENGDYVELVAR